MATLSKWTATVNIVKRRSTTAQKADLWT
jgi:hypothetical protein